MMTYIYLNNYTIQISLYYYTNNEESQSNLVSYLIPETQIKNILLLDQQILLQIKVPSKILLSRIEASLNRPQSQLPL